MSKSDKTAVRKTESIIPKSIRRAEKQVDIALKGLSHGYIDEIWNEVDELEEFDTRGHLSHKQKLR